MGTDPSGLFYSKGRKNDDNEKKRKKERKKLQRFNPLDMILPSYLILELLISMSVIKTLQTGSFSLSFVFELISLCVFSWTFCTLKFLLTQTVGLGTSGVWTCESVFIEPREFNALRASPFQVALVSSTLYVHAKCVQMCFCMHICSLVIPLYECSVAMVTMTSFAPRDFILHSQKKSNTLLWVVHSPPSSREGFFFECSKWVGSFHTAGSSHVWLKSRIVVKKCNLDWHEGCSTVLLPCPLLLTLILI